MRLRGVSASDSFVLYASLFTGLFFAPKTAQDDATALELSRHVATIYTTLCKMAVNTPAALVALDLLINYVHASDTSKRAIVAQGVFYAQLWEADVARNDASPQVFSLLKSLVLHSDGVLAAIERGFIAKAVASLDETLRQIAKGSKNFSIAAVGPLVEVLVNVASFVVTALALVASTFAAAAAVDTPAIAKLSAEAGQTTQNLREGGQKECFGSICGGGGIGWGLGGFGWGLGGGCGLFSPFGCGGWF
ncbi:hypothetical protein SPRG_08982 [Saprolegnia parasitica CBS 223.65]|uniref:Uncharacterized protein n=1 Tax=Saprolegnia parasitica (strain CBS 223.65) TaxID=695850 RepID=A0A067C5C2_SAPPC|nr:hypothetical protein SPRG_08982 [Saprolegnia parasitica CBS 223.65]KDO25683.1 hypothetical protein SPRG_08982 [Saprolegnia parasitica CBS 223.65]|eukprot:XP_012203713.1 hypothetical protein SPRG_08982 [Saprolegnia parasitica CBS 223.65]